MMRFPTSDWHNRGRRLKAGWESRHPLFGFHLSCKSCFLLLNGVTEPGMPGEGAEGPYSHLGYSLVSSRALEVS